MPDLGGVSPCSCCSGAGTPLPADEPMEAGPLQCPTGTKPPRAAMPKWPGKGDTAPSNSEAGKTSPDGPQEVMEKYVKKVEHMVPSDMPGRAQLQWAVDHLEDCRETAHIRAILANVPWMRVRQMPGTKNAMGIRRVPGDSKHFLRHPPEG